MWPRSRRRPWPRHTARGVQFVGSRIVNPPANAAGAGRGGPPLTSEQQAILTRGGAIYTELCFSCHGEDGRGTPVPGAQAGTVMAPSMSGSSRVNGHRDYVIKPLLHGMTGPIDGRSYPQVMVPTGLEHRSVDRRRRELRSQQLRELRDVGDRCGRRAGARDHHEPQDAVDARRAGNVPAPTDHSGQHVEGHGQPQSRRGRGRARLHALDERCAAAAWHVDPGRPAAARHADRDRVRFAASRRRERRATGGTFPRAYRVEVSTDGATWSAVAEGQGSGRITSIAFAPVRASFVRITQTATADPASGCGWAAAVSQMLRISKRSSYRGLQTVGDAVFSLRSVLALPRDTRRSGATPAPSPAR